MIFGFFYDLKVILLNINQSYLDYNHMYIFTV